MCRVINNTQDHVHVLDALVLLTTLCARGAQPLN